MQISALKTLTALSTGAEALKNTIKNRNYEKAPQFMKEKMAGDCDTAWGFLKESEAIIKMTKKCAKDGTRLPELSFEAGDLSTLARSIRKDISDFRAFEKLCR